MLCSGETRYGLSGHMVEGPVREGADWVLQIEYLVVNFDEQNREVKLSLRQADILEALASDPELLKQGGGVPDLARGKAKYVLPRNLDLVSKMLTQI